MNRRSILSESARSVLENVGTSVPNTDSSRDKEKGVQAKAMDTYTEQAVLFLRQTLKEQRLQAVKRSREVEMLRREAHNKELSTLEMVAYLQNQMKLRERDNAELASKLSSFLQREQEHLRHVEGACADRLAKHEEESKRKIAEAKRVNETLESELEDLRQFRDNRERLNNGLKKAEKQISEITRQSELNVAKLERDHRSEVSRIKNETQLQINRINRQSKENAERELTMESQRLRNDNSKLREELNFHERNTSELVADNERLKKLLQSAKREIELSRGKEIHFAKRGAKQKRDILELTTKVETSERECIVQARTHKADAEAREKKLMNELEVANSRCSEFQRISAIKEKELCHIRRLASVVVSHRTETEKFFLQALEDVKKDIAAEKPYNASRPSSRGKQTRSSARKVELKDLDLRQRERVLTLLFKRMNKGMHTDTPENPKHSFSAISTKQEKSLYLPPPYTPGLTFLTEQHSAVEEKNSVNR